MLTAMAKLRSLFKRVPSPKVVTLAGVELLSVGDHPTVVGPGNITKETLEAIAEGEGIFGASPLKVGHFDKRLAAQQDGDPAYGWVQNMRVELRKNKAGQLVDTLVGDYAGVPEQFAGLLVSETDEDGKVVRRAAYPSRSAEILWDVPLPGDPEKSHPAMLRAVALLGTTNPADKGLNDVLDVFYPDEDDNEELLTAAAERPGKVTTLLATINLDDIRKAWREANPYTPNDPESSTWVREVWLDTGAADGTAGFLIVDREAQDELDRVPWSIAEDGGVAFGEAQKVKVEYTAASAQDTADKLLLAGRLDDESAGGTVSANDGPAAPKEDTKVDRDKLIAQLKAAGHTIADDATDEQLLALVGTAPAPKAETEGEPTETTETTETTTKTETTETPKPEALAQAITEGTVVGVSKEVWEDTQARLKKLEDDKAESLKEADAELVESALSDGRILPAERDHYVTLLSNPAVRETAVTLLSSLEPGRMPTIPMGDDHNPEDVPDAVEKQLWPEDYANKGGN